MPITKSTPISQIINDFVNSTDSRFDGKSKEERIKMAKGTYYGIQNESINNLIAAVITENKEETKSLIESILIEKIQTRLEEQKQEIMSEMFVTKEIK